MTRILAVLNQKGGVGKTTTCVNLGAALARRGFKVLLIDIDPQANLTVHLGGDLRDVRRSTYSLLLSEHALAPAVRQTATPGLRYVPSTLALANAEIQLASAVGRELLLREAIEVWLEEENTGEESPRAHFIIIDCPPSLGILTMNALCAANEVVLPIQTEFFALQGVAGILESLKAVQRLNRGLRLSMVVPCMWDRRTTLARDVVEEVEKYFGKLVSKTRIRNNVKLAEAPSHGMTIFEYDASSNGAKDYALLAKEVLGEPLDDPEPKPVRAKSAPRSARTDEADDESADAGAAADESAVLDDAPPAGDAAPPPASAAPAAPPQDSPAADVVAPQIVAEPDSAGSAETTAVPDVPRSMPRSSADASPAEPEDAVAAGLGVDPVAGSPDESASGPAQESVSDAPSATLPPADLDAGFTAPIGSPAIGSPAATAPGPCGSDDHAVAADVAADVENNGRTPRESACPGASGTTGASGAACEGEAAEASSAAPSVTSARHGGAAGDVVADVLAAQIDAAFAAASADAARDD